MVLAMIAHSAVQSSTRTYMHNAILFIDILTMLSPIGKPYLAIIASNDRKI